ncbi:MAG: flagellar basal body-associated FliL family protein [Alphaproteobacteria bacterium]|nr:flagellar basal body-associated FliL family protein [Alphaproteobacteria bacterium]
MAEEEKNKSEAVSAEAADMVKKAKSGKKKLLILLIPVLIMLASVLGLYFTKWSSKDTEEGSPEVKDISLENNNAIDETTAFFYDLPDQWISLNALDRQHQIVFKAKVTLEMENAEGVKYAQDMLPRIQDTMQFYFREMRIEEIQGSIGIYRLREEILGRLNKILSPNKVINVLFREMSIQ